MGLFEQLCCDQEGNPRWNRDKSPTQKKHQHKPQASTQTSSITTIELSVMSSLTGTQRLKQHWFGPMSHWADSQPCGGREVFKNLIQAFFSHKSTAACVKGKRRWVFEQDVAASEWIFYSCSWFDYSCSFIIVHANEVYERLIREEWNQPIRRGSGQHVDTRVIHHRTHVANILSLKLHYLSFLQGGVERGFVSMHNCKGQHK